MAWFKRKEKGITTATEDKKDVPKGLWYKSPTGKIVDSEELERNLWVSPEDDYHVRIGSAEYFRILFDDNEFKELDANLTSQWELLLAKKFREELIMLSIINCHL
jgi:acetyl-CoA carboxylase carboxyl transferase subunit beta